MHRPSDQCDSPTISHSTISHPDNFPPDNFPLRHFPSWTLNDLPHSNEIWRYGRCCDVEQTKPLHNSCSSCSKKIICVVHMRKSNGSVGRIFLFWFFSGLQKGGTFFEVRLGSTVFIGWMKYHSRVSVSTPDTPPDICFKTYRKGNLWWSFPWTTRLSSVTTKGKWCGA